MLIPTLEAIVDLIRNEASIPQKLIKAILEKKPQIEYQSVKSIKLLKEENEEKTATNPNHSRQHKQDYKLSNDNESATESEINIQTLVPAQELEISTASLQDDLDLLDVSNVPIVIEEKKKVASFWFNFVA